MYTHFNLLDDLINLDRVCRKESIYNIVITLVTYGHYVIMYYVISCMTMTQWPCRTSPL